MIKISYFWTAQDRLFEEYYRNQSIREPAKLKRPPKAQLTPSSKEVTSIPTSSTTTTPTIAPIIILNVTTKALTESLKKTIPLEDNTTSPLFQTTQEVFQIDVEKNYFSVIENRKSIVEFWKQYQFENPQVHRSTAASWSWNFDWKLYNVKQWSESPRDGPILL